MGVPINRCLPPNQVTGIRRLAPGLVIGCYATPCRFPSCLFYRPYTLCLMVCLETTALRRNPGIRRRALPTSARRGCDVNGQSGCFAHSLMTYIGRRRSSQFPIFADGGYRLPYEATVASLGGMRWSHSSATSRFVRRRATDRSTLILPSSIMVRTRRTSYQLTAQSHVPPVDREQI
jgi:hypothetical protein